MDRWVSKYRTKKTRSLLKKSGKGRVVDKRLPLNDRGSIALLLLVLGWLLTFGIIDFNVGHPSETFVDRLYAKQGMLLLVAASLLICASLARIMHQASPVKNSQLLLHLMLSFLGLLPAKGLFHLMSNASDLSSGTLFMLIPLSLSPLLATILMSSKDGMLQGLWISMTASLMAAHAGIPDILGHGSNQSQLTLLIFTTGLITTVVSSHLAGNVRTRKQSFQIGAIIGLSKLAMVVVLAAINKTMLSDMIYEASAAMISGIMSAVLALLILPLFEMSFKITTDISLLELAGLDHPLLEQLSIEAPGTWHHSQVMAILASEAASEIGANALEARVCAHFHDIGKLTKPEFFTENNQFHSNPHDDLSPSMSTLIILSHVKEGISMAMNAKLPRPIIDVIQEHHGTSVVQFFHHKAVQMEKSSSTSNGQNKPTVIKEGDFRYPGPRPKSKVSAIICLADSVEAASRSIEKPTPAHIENLVNEIVNAKVRDNQLDLCSLTFSELTKVKRSFIFTLTNMLHSRIAYPTDEDRDSKPAETAPRIQEQDSKTEPVPVGENAST
jgi:putative nucleotidyltransferase with HDIG domain